MRTIIYDEKYKYKYGFDDKTGAYIRTGILDDKGNDTGIDPFMGSFPHLIDVGVMGHCIHGKTGLCAKAGIGCYQSGLFVEQPNMTIENFRWIAEQCKGRCNQLALGGRGDPDQHENFEELLHISRENDLVPNYTTSGYGMTTKLAEISTKYCGAVAVSWYRSRYTENAIRMLIDAGAITNIHYVLGKNSITEAIDRLKNDAFPRGINAVIFLLHKPAGQGSAENVLSYEAPEVKEFFSLFDKNHRFKVGMDSCSVPGALNLCRNILTETLDTCEGGRFSCYIGADMTMVPCSFDQRQHYKVRLKGMTIEQAWNSDAFDQFRSKLLRSCPECERRELCMGGCPLMPEIVLCASNKRSVPQDTVI